MGLETGFLCQIFALLSKRIEETRFLGWNLFHKIRLDCTDGLTGKMPVPLRTQMIEDSYWLGVYMNYV